MLCLSNCAIRQCTPVKGATEVIGCEQEALDLDHSEKALTEPRSSSEGMVSKMFLNR